MSDFEIEVIGAKPPKPPEGPLRRLLRRLGRIAKAVLMRPKAVVLVGLTGAVLVIGTPHAGWDYQCRHPMRGPGTCESVAWCAYYGVQGRRVEVPDYGEQCKLIAFIPLDWQRIKGG